MIRPSSVLDFRLTEICQTEMICTGDVLVLKRHFGRAGPYNILHDSSIGASGLYHTLFDSNCGKCVGHSEFECVGQLSDQT